MTDSQLLTTLLVQVRQSYNDLEQAFVPISEAIRDLEQGWKPRALEFWERLLTSLTLLQQAVNACLALRYQESSSQPEPVSTLIKIASIEQRCSLHYVTHYVEEVGIRLTAYQKRDSLAQRYLWQRQGVLWALRELNEAGQEALIKGKIWLDQVLHGQDVSCIPSAKPTVRKTTLTSRRGTPSSNRASARSKLRLVSSRETKENSSGTTRSG